MGPEHLETTLFYKDVQLLRLLLPSVIPVRGRQAPYAHQRIRIFRPEYPEMNLNLTPQGKRALTLQEALSLKNLIRQVVPEENI